MPVSEVKAVLDAPDALARNALIAAHLGRLEAELAQTRAAVDSLRNLLRPPVDAPSIEHRSVPATRAAGIAAVVDRADILPWWQGALAELHASARAQGLHATGPSGGVYASELFQHDRGEATVFIPVEGSVRAIGRVTPVAIPAAELAVITHQGSLDDADLSYATLGSYATRHEISVDGPLREYYLRGASDTPDEAEWRTEIGWPIFRADGSAGTTGGPGDQRRGQPAPEVPAAAGGQAVRRDRLPARGPHGPAGGPGPARVRADARLAATRGQEGAGRRACPARPGSPAVSAVPRQAVRPAGRPGGRRLRPGAAGAARRHERDDPAAQERGHHVLLRAARGTAGDRLRPGPIHRGRLPAPPGVPRRADPRGRSGLADRRGLRALWGLRALRGLRGLRALRDFGTGQP